MCLLNAYLPQVAAVAVFRVFRASALEKKPFVLEDLAQRLGVKGSLLRRTHRDLCRRLNMEEEM